MKEEVRPSWGMDKNNGIREKGVKRKLSVSVNLVKGYGIKSITMYN